MVLRTVPAFDKKSVSIKVVGHALFVCCDIGSI